MAATAPNNVKVKAMNQAEALALIAEIFECPNTLAPSTQKHNVRGWDSMGC